MSQRRLNNASEVGSVSIAPYEYAAVYDYLGKNRYLQASFCKSVAKLYSDKFGMYTTKYLSNIAADEGCIGMLEWSKDIGCRWDASVFVSGATGGHVDVLRWLVSNGCPAPRGNVPWIAAVKGGHIEVLKFAHDSKCLPNAHNFRHLCKVAAENSQIHILKWVYEVEGNKHFDANTCAAAANAGRLDSLQYLRSIGCAWGVLTCWGAMSHGHVDVLKWAIDNGCRWDANKRGQFGETKLHQAQHVEVIEFLISRGANINAVDKDGRTPLHMQVLGGDLDAVKTLIRLCANVNLADVNHKTPLDMAIARGYLEMVDVLRAAGAREST